MPSGGTHRAGDRRLKAVFGAPTTPILAVPAFVGARSDLPRKEQS
jgi:hypothetical protein